MVSITSYLINELTKNKIKLIVCDEKHNPVCELTPYYGAHNTSKRVQMQALWKKEVKNRAWKTIIKHKIYNQAQLLKKLNIDGYEKLLEYASSVEEGDLTNREGHAAKVYFNLLFGKDFSRGIGDNTNIALDYGYSILLSSFNREIVSKGYITQLGINHKNEFNQYNLSCDLMEPYRPLIDEIVLENRELVFGKEFKLKLLNVLNKRVDIDDRNYFVPNAVSIFTNSVLNFMDKNGEGIIINYEL